MKGRVPWEPWKNYNFQKSKVRRRPLRVNANPTLKFRRRELVIILKGLKVSEGYGVLIIE